MEQYIDKAALVAAIEKRLHQERFLIKDYHDAYTFGLESALRIINTLEVKEVDLDEEFDKYCETLYLIDLENEPYAELFECARYFFELGLKVQKEENCGKELEIRYGGFCARYSDGKFCLHYEIERSEELEFAVPV